MADASKRFDQLSPERRKLLDLLKTKGVTASASADAAAAPESGGEGTLRLDYTTSSDQAKENYRRFYNEVSKQLDATLFGSFSYFLNYGYVSDGSPEFSPVDLPDKYINRNSVKLVLEVIGDCDLEESRILDVGCGRGGTIHVVHEFFQPRSMTGIDLSANAIQFCRRAHKYPDTCFREGDAEKLLFAESSYDVVTNIESSHSYPNIRSFYMEVWRVLAPGGYFLYADVMTREKSNQGVGVLRSLGFELERDRDITKNVLLSCDQISATRMQAFQGGNDPALMGNFLAAPGSEVYEQMQSRAWIYRILKLRKASS